MTLTYKDREIEIEVEFEPGEGARVDSGYYVDTEVALTDAECEEVEEIHQEYLYQEALEWAASRAYDRAKDFAKYGDD